MKPYKRVDRVSDIIKRELASIIQQKGQDPRFTQVTITHVDIAPDFSNARVYITLLLSKSEIDQTEVIRALNNAKGFFQKILSKNIRLRRIPKLIFEYDRSVLQASHLTELINAAVTADEQQHSTKDEADQISQ